MQRMNTRNGLVLVLLGAIFAVLLVFLVITLVKGDDSAKGGAGVELIVPARLWSGPS